MCASAVVRTEGLLTYVTPIAPSQTCGQHNAPSIQGAVSQHGSARFRGLIPRGPCCNDFSPP
jgi:hypothetical protein